MIKIKEVYIRWLGIPTLAFALVFVVKTEEEIETQFWSGFLTTLTFTAVLWNGIYLIIELMRRWYTEINQTAKRLIFTSIYSTLFLIIASNILEVSLGICDVSEFLEFKYFFRHAHINFACALMVASVYEANFFFNKWKDSVIQNQELKSQQIKTQYSVLQNQMSPHFLFNSLNTLTTLISEDPKIAIDFTQTLAEVYRYILQNRERELVHLTEEVEFCQSYVFLLKKRYPENLHVDFTIPDHNFYIAPLTIQMLIENAIKHNVVSKSDPLHIDINLENDHIMVRNNLQPKSSLEISTKTGLDNIQKRYALLGDRQIRIYKSDDYFTVTIPMIELISEVEHLKSVV